MDTLLPILLTTIMFALVMTGMAVGVIFSNRELKGSCGGEGAEDCFCDQNNLPRACELGEELPEGCGDHDHAHELAKLSGHKITLSQS